MADLIEEFKTIRKSSGLSQKAVTEGTGISTITVYTWESKQRQPTLENFSKVLSNLGYGLKIEPLASAVPDAQHD